MSLSKAPAAPIQTEKLAQAVRLVREAGLDAWLTFVRETGAGSDPVLPLVCDSGLTWQSALIVAASGERIAVVGNYDAEPLQASGVWTEVVPYVQSIREPLLAALERTVRPEGKIGVNFSTSDDKADGLTHGMRLLLDGYLAGTRLAGSIVSAEPVVTRLRGEKTRTEIEKIRGAIAQGDRIFSEIAGFAKVGRSELEVFEFVHRLMAERGLGFAWDPSGDPIVNSGPDSMIGHGKPSSRIQISPGHVFHVDLGVVSEGYSSDVQRCWFVGDSVPNDVQEGLDAVNRAITAAAEALRPGVLGHEVDAVARGSIVASGYPEYLHAVGHQVGRLAHDGGAVLGPRWERYGSTVTTPVRLGEVYTLELGVTLPGRGYLGIEEMVVVKDSGCEFLTVRQQAMPVL
ncbi:MAG: aminopeptidase P family protein [Fimbriimonadaceae bacterium]|nr:aminopeptidase P family protein [Fimbriimonadaceae bacterium]QYK59370.1 MAG: aminopeptidase P family protein [Fimbriimonadaceae bacterium]